MSVRDFPAIVVMGRGTVERYQPGPDEVCVSIRSPGESPPVLAPAFGAVLRLAFVDAYWAPVDDDVIDGHPLLSRADALAVATFVGEHAPTASRVVIHCAVGASRSVSVALALADGFLRNGAPRPIRRSSDGREGSLDLPPVDRAPHPSGAPNPHTYLRVLAACRAYAAA